MQDEKRSTIVQGDQCSDEANMEYQPCVVQESDTETAERITLNNVASGSAYRQASEIDAWNVNYSDSDVLESDDQLTPNQIQELKDQETSKKQCDHAGLDTDVVTIGADEHVADGKNLQPVKEKQFDHAGQATDVKIIGTDEYIADDENKKPFKDKEHQFCVVQESDTETTERITLNNVVSGSAYRLTSEMDAWNVNYSDSDVLESDDQLTPNQIQEMKDHEEASYKKQRDHARLDTKADVETIGTDEHIADDKDIQSDLAGLNIKKGTDEYIAGIAYKSATKSTRFKDSKLSLIHTSGVLWWLLRCCFLLVYSTAASSGCPLQCSIQNSLCQYQCSCGGYPNGIAWMLNGTSTQDGVSNDLGIYSQLTVPPHIANNTNITCHKVDSNAHQICSNSTIGQVSPSPIENMKIDAFSNQLTVTWTAPSTGNIPSSYSVSINDSIMDPVSILHNDSSVYSHTFTGLLSETVYAISVMAVNCAGTSNVVTISERTTGIPQYCGSDNTVISNALQSSTTMVTVAPSQVNTALFDWGRCNTKEL
eukprot:Em0001g2829a